MKTMPFLLFILFPFLLKAQEGTKNFIDFHYIEVTGKADMDIVPDEIYLKILIDEKDNKAKQSVEDLEKQMVKKLQAIGIDVSKDLSIQDFASNFKNYWLRNNKIYTSKEYQLIVHDGKTAGEVFRGLEEIGISNISIEKVDHSKIDEYKKEVKINAIKAAKDKASAMAEAIGQSIGRAVFVQEQNFGIPMQKSPMASNIRIRGFSDVEVSDREPDIEFEKIHLEYSVLVRFELK